MLKKYVTREQIKNKYKELNFLSIYSRARYVSSTVLEDNILLWLDLSSRKL